MAKVVRKNKVSKKATAGQKRRGNIFHNNWFWIIGSIALVVIASAIIIPVVIHINKTKSDDDTDVVDYFRTSEEVNFTFQTYNGLKNYITPDYVGVEGESLFKEKVIIFAYDKTQFYPNQAYEKDDDDSTIYNAEHKALLERIVNLQKVVDKHEDYKLYIVDTSVGSNASIYVDETFGGLYDDDAQTYPVLIYIENGEYKSSYETEEGNSNTKTYICSDSDVLDISYINNTLANNLTNYIIKNS